MKFDTLLLPCCIKEESIEGEYREIRRRRVSKKIRYLGDEIK